MADMTSVQNKLIAGVKLEHEKNLQKTIEKVTQDVREEWTHNLEIINLRYKQEVNRTELCHS